jgi:hypothetical protein
VFRHFAIDPDIEIREASAVFARADAGAPCGRQPAAAYCCGTVERPF